MQVLKFGGTSVGSAERMKALVSLVVNTNPKIVVLSAMSGTTNSLVEIANALYEKDYAKAVELINKLEDKYKLEITKLYSKETSLNKGTQLIKYHFDYIRSFT